MIQFVRTYPFYLKLNKPVRAYSFSVTVTAQKKLNPATGMSVDLVKLDRAAKLILKTKNSKSAEVLQALREIYGQFEAQLKKDKTKLISIQFNECRGSGYLLKGKKTLFIRSDFAADDQQDLHQVTSYFDAKNKLVRMDLKHLRLQIVEQLLF